MSTGSIYLQTPLLISFLPLYWLSLPPPHNNFSARNLCPHKASPLTACDRKQWGASHISILGSIWKSWCCRYTARLLPLPCYAEAVPQQPTAWWTKWKYSQSAAASRAPQSCWEDRVGSSPRNTIHSHLPFFPLWQPGLCLFCFAT